MLLATLGLELGDLRLHAAQHFLHGSQLLQHLALGPLAFRLRQLLGALSLDELAVLLLLLRHLLTQRRRGGLQPGEFTRQLRAV